MAEDFWKMFSYFPLQKPANCVPPRTGPILWFFLGVAIKLGIFFVGPLRGGHHADSQVPGQVDIDPTSLPELPKPSRTLGKQPATYTFRLDFRYYYSKFVSSCPRFD